jgi:oxygen-independent coproporphyrinogen-3 oxidase
VYCDFSIAVRSTVPVDDYLEGIERELRGAVSSTVETVYLGGGTPSKLGGHGVRALLELVRAKFNFSPGAEVTIEANPEDVTPEAVDAWTSAGINRLSLGAQSFHDNVLTWMHRTHDAKQIKDSGRIAKHGGVDNISLDLIFAVPPEIDRSWSDDLDAALEMEPQHVSLYGLTIEPATPLSRWIDQRHVSITSEDRYAEEFLLAHERLTSQGFAHYEVSNFALPTRESRHNSAYWKGEPYLGIGPAAHSFDGTRRRWNVKPYTEWLARLREEETVIEAEEFLDSENKAAERVYLGLRTSEGYHLGAADSDRATAERWARAGWAVIDGGLVRLNAEGWLRLDALATGLTGC